LARSSAPGRPSRFAQPRRVDASERPQFDELLAQERRGLRCCGESDKLHIETRKTWDKVARIATSVRRI
jgi:hypothetical protein